MMPSSGDFLRKLLILIGASAIIVQISKERRITVNDSESINIIRSCINPPSVCKIGFNDQQYEEFFFPLSVSDTLFIGIVDKDFILDGYTIRRISDVSYAEKIGGTYLKIHRAEGNLNRISAPPINVKSWKHALSSLLASSENVIVEGYIPDTARKYFLVGRILAVGEQGIRFRSFDGSGQWSDRTVTIKYDDITAVTFGSSYVTTYSKYIKPYPEIIQPVPKTSR